MKSALSGMTLKIVVKNQILESSLFGEYCKCENHESNAIKFLNSPGSGYDTATTEQLGLWLAPGDVLEADGARKSNTYSQTHPHTLSSTFYYYSFFCFQDVLRKIFLVGDYDLKTLFHPKEIEELRNAVIKDLDYASVSKFERSLKMFINFV